MHRKKKPFGRPNQIHHACEPVIKKIFKIPRTHQHEPNLKSILSMLMVMNRSDAGSTQDCFAFSTFYNHISTPTMVVQVTKKSPSFCPHRHQHHLHAKVKISRPWRIQLWNTSAPLNSQMVTGVTGPHTGFLLLHLRWPAIQLYNQHCQEQGEGSCGPVQAR